MTEPLSPLAARRVFLTLTTTRWLPIGFVVGLLVLWQLERGLTLPQALTASAVMGIAVVALELPTSGFADALGRRPVLIAAALANVAAMVALLVAHSFTAFVIASVLTGVFRALDSGPLEAWYVDTVHATRPGADVDQDLSRSTSILGLAIAGGALLSGGLVAWHPIGSHSALWLPVVICLVLSVLHLGAVVVLLREPVTHVDSTGWSRALSSARETPGVIASGLRLVRDNPVLRGLVLLEVFWSTAMISMESLTPVRMAELLGGEERAGLRPLGRGARRDPRSGRPLRPDARDGSGRRAGRPRRRPPARLHRPRHAGPGLQRAAAPRGDLDQPRDRAVARLDVRLRLDRHHPATGRPARRRDLDPRGHGCCGSLRPRWRLVPAAIAASRAPTGASFRRHHTRRRSGPRPAQ